MQITSTALHDVFIVETASLIDQRGEFSRLYCEQELNNIVGDRRIVQMNQSNTVSIGAVRGFHYQKPPHAEMKLIRCIKGSIWDVAVDLRKGSPTFLQWHAEELSKENAKMMVIPEGFQVLTENSELIYLHTSFYAPEAEGGIRVLDPVLSVDWPLMIKDLSVRDKNHPFIDDSFTGIVL